MKDLERTLGNRFQFNFTSFSKVAFLYVSLRFFVDGTEEYFILPTAWYYIKSFGQTNLFLGFTVAAYSIGAVLFAPCIGFLDVRLQATKTIVLFSGLLKMFGNLLYSIPFNEYFPLFGRLTSGIAEGSVGVLYGEVAKCTDNENRAKAFLFFEGLYCVGAAVGPMVGSILTIDIDILGWKINAGNSPGFILTIIWFLLLILSLFLPSNLAGNKSEQEKTPNTRSSDDEACSDSEPFFDETPKNGYSKISCLYYIIFSSCFLYNMAVFYIPLLATHQLGLRLIHVKVLFLNQTLFAFISYLASYLFLCHFSEKIVLAILIVSQIVPISILFSFAFSWNDPMSVNGVYLLQFLMFFRAGGSLYVPLGSSLLSKATPVNRGAFYQSFISTMLHLAIICSRLMGGYTFDRISMRYACLGLTVSWLVEFVWFCKEYRNLAPVSTKA